MNEKYMLTAELADLTGEFRLDRIEFAYEMTEHYEPIGQIPVIVPVGRERRLGGQRWGLMPYWGKSSLYVDRDAAGVKPYLQAMLAKKRCVVPCSAMIVEKTEGKIRRFYRREHREKRVFGVAGIYDVWVDSEKNEYPMCTMLTTAPAYPGDERLPLVLEGEALDIWLDPGRNSADAIRGLLRTIPNAEFRTEAVDPMPRALK